MNIARILKVTVVASIVYVIWDYVQLNYLLAGAMAGMASITNPVAPSFLSMVLLDVVAAAVVALAYDRVRGSFEAGVKGGAVFGCYAGLLANLPIWLGMHVYLKDIAYGAAWHFTLLGIVGYILMGVAAGAVGGDAATT